MATQYVLDNFYQQTSAACLTDITPPTFAGITGCVAQPNGSILASWGSATDGTPPIEFNVYVQAGTATGLFASGNLALITSASSAYIFLLNDVSRLLKGVTYYVGVRAKDAVGNIETNTTSLSAVSTGVLDDDLATIAANLAATEALLAVERSQCKGVFSISNANEFQGELWFEFKGQAVNSLLGTASYTVYDSSDNAVAGLTQSGISANGNGIFLITPVSAAGLEPFVNYRVKITITYNSVAYTSHKGFTVGE